MPSRDIPTSATTHSTPTHQTLMSPRPPGTPDMGGVKRYRPTGSTSTSSDRMGSRSKILRSVTWSPAQLAQHCPSSSAAKGYTPTRHAEILYVRCPYCCQAAICGLTAIGSSTLWDSTIRPEIKAPCRKAFRRHGWRVPAVKRSPRHSPRILLPAGLSGSHPIHCPLYGLSGEFDGGVDDL